MDFMNNLLPQTPKLSLMELVDNYADIFVDQILHTSNLPYGNFWMIAKNSNGVQNQIELKKVPLADHKGGTYMDEIDATNES